MEAVLTSITNLGCPIQAYYDKLVAEKDNYQALCDTERSEIGTEDYFCSMLDRINVFLYKTEL